MFKVKGLTKESKYRILLITIIAFIFLTPLSTNYNATKWISAALFAFLLCGASLNVRSSGYSSWVLACLGLIAIGTNFNIDGSILWPLINKISGLAFFLYAVMLFGSNIFKKGNHDLDHIYGSISVYLLIGLTYSYAYMILSLINPMSLIYSINYSPITSQFDFHYFSFITLTTIGFGDIVANNGPAKAVVIIESITGLFYLAVLVASLTSLLSKKLR